MDTVFQAGIAKSPLLDVHQILLSRKQRAATKTTRPRGARFVPESRNQIVHNGDRDSVAFARINVSEQYQMAEQHAPIETEPANQMRPIEFHRAAAKNMRNVGAIEALALHYVRLHRSEERRVGQEGIYRW